MAGLLTSTLRPFEPNSDRDAAAVCRLVGLAFGMGPEAVRTWIDFAGREHWRLIDSAGGPPACLLLVPCGMFLGGRSVPGEGITGVAVAPEARGRGLARRLISEVLLDQHARGMGVSLLYSAQHALYRAAGYEQAAMLCHASVPVGLLTAGAAGAAWRRFSEQDLPEVRACYEVRARPIDGMLDRGAYLWGRIQRPRGGPAEGFVCDDGRRGVEAYAFLQMGDYYGDKPSERELPGCALRVSDMGWSSGRGLERLLSFLRGFSSTVSEIRFACQPNSPLLLSLTDRRYRLRVFNRIMLRVVDVRRALAARGYPAGLSASLDLEIADGVIEANSGRWRVLVEAGRASVERGGEGRCRLDVRDFAALFGGSVGAHELAAAGRLDAGAEDLARCDLLFGRGGGAWTLDAF